MKKKDAIKQLRALEAQYVEAQRRFDAASRGDRMAGWHTRTESANVDLVADRPLIRQRSRSLRANNPYGASAVAGLSSYIVGHGVNTVFSDPELTRAFSQWANSTEPDHDGQQSLFGIQSMLTESMIEAGDGLAIRRGGYGGTPLSIQVLEPEHLDTMRFGPSPDGSGEDVVCGVQYARGTMRATGYWILPEHPGDVLRSGQVSEFVPASHVVHVYRRDRPTMGVGMPWCAPVVVAIRDFAETNDAMRIRQKIAACLAVLVKDMEPADPTPGLAGVLGQKLPATRLEPGLISRLPAGTDATIVRPESDSGYKSFADVSLLEIAAGYQIPYELLTGDLSNANYSSLRARFNMFFARLDQFQWLTMAPMVYSKIARWWLEARAAVGDRINVTEALASCTHVMPVRPLLDPSKDLPPKIQAIQANLLPYEDALQADGRDLLTTIAQIKRSRDALEAAGISTTIGAPSPLPSANQPTEQA